MLGKASDAHDLLIFGVCSTIFSVEKVQMVLQALNAPLITSEMI